MIGKLIALVAFVAAVASADCGFYTTGNTGYRCEGSVLNVAPTFTVASAFPACSPIAVPTCVIEPITTTTAQVSTPVVAPVVTPCVTPIVAPVATEIVGRVYNNEFVSGCGSRVLNTVY